MLERHLLSAFHISNVSTWIVSPEQYGLGVRDCPPCNESHHQSGGAECEECLACRNAARRASAYGSCAPKSTPMRRTRSPCALTARGHAAAAPPSSVMNSRRLTKAVT